MAISPGPQVLQQQMRGPVHEQRNQDQITQQVDPSRYYVLLMPVRASGPVHVKLRPPKIIDGNHNPRYQRRQHPASAVVAQPPDTPEQ